MTDLPAIIAMQISTISLQQAFIRLLDTEVKAQAETIKTLRGEVACLRLDLAEERAGK